MRTALALLTVILVPVVLLGCGGGSPTQDPAGQETRGPRITQSPTLDQLRADLAAAGKPMPEFLAGGGTWPAAAPRSDEITTQNLMSALSLTVWSPARTVARNRVMWFECYLSSGTYPTDVALYRTAGDPDLFVFSPLDYNYPEDSLQLIGYSVDAGSDAVGSFYPEDWANGPGRFVAAVYGYQSTNSFRIRFW